MSGLPRRSGALLFAACCSAACQGTGSSERPDAIARDAERVVRKAVAQGFLIEEVRRAGDDLTKPKGTLVDYESTVIVRPLRVELARAIGVDGEAKATLDAASLRDIDADIEQTAKALATIEKLQPLVATIADYQRRSNALYQKAVAPGALVQTDPEWRAVKQLQQGIVASLQELAITYVNYRDYDGKLDADALPDAAEQAIELVYNLMAPTGSGGSKQDFVPGQVTAHINFVTRFLTARLQHLADLVVAKAPEATLEMEARLVRGEEKLPITISPYTIVDGVGRGSKSRRVGVPSKQDLDRVQVSYEAYERLARSLNELHDLAGDPAKLDELQRQALASLKTAVESVRGKLRRHLDQLAGDGGDEVAAVQEAANGLREALDQALAAWQALVDAPPAEPIGFARELTTLLENLRGPLRARLLAFQGLLEGVPADVSDAARALAAETKAAIDAEIAALPDALDDAPGIGSLAGAFSALRSLRSIARTRTFGNLEPGKITSNPIDLRLAEAGEIDLDASPAESGDRLEVSYTLTKNPAGPETERRTYVGSRSVDVRKFGFYDTLKSQILFYDRLHDGVSTYRAAPGISYNLHARPEWGQGFWDVVAPGLGVSVSAPSFEDATELAIGAQFTVFNDMVQIGYAYNISVDDNQEMFYFGLDLIGVFRAIE